MIEPLLQLGDVAMWALRIAVGAILLVHGWPKIRDLSQNAEDFAMMGFKPGKLWGTLVALLEVGGGIMLIAGLFVQIVGVLVAVQFLAVIFTVKRGESLKGGYEFELLIAVAALVLAGFGGGALGADRVFDLSVW